MNPRQNLIRTSPAFALISVLALVSLAALTATAFLASARLEKTAAMTIGDQTRLTLALDSGYHLASYTFTKGDNTWNWADFLVGEDTDGVGYLYHAVPYAGSTVANVGQWYNYATFSCATLSNIGVTLVDPTNYSATTTWQGGFASNRLDASSRLSRMTNFSTTNVTPSGPVTRIPLLFSRTSPIVNWITNYVTNPTTLLLTPNYRFAYFTEDLSGLIDAERMGGSSSRATGTNPNEIALGEIGLTNLTTFTNLRPMFLNPGLIESVIRTNGLTYGSVTNPWRYLASGTYSLNSRLSTSINHRQGYLKVPSGLGYPVADTNANAVSTNKLNLNTLFNGGVATATALSQITATITNNLPRFTNRAGGMAGGTYVSNIAANIVDYVDTDGSPTTSGTYGTINYSQGVDSYPWVNEVATRVTVQSYTASSSNLVLNMRGFAELWNLSDKPFTGDISLTMQENDFIKAENASGSAPNATNTALITSGTLSTNITILPMEFKVVEVFSNLVTLTVPEPTGAGTKYVTWPTASTNSTFELKIGAVTVQKPLGGLARRVDTSKTLTGNSDCLDLTTPALMETGANSRKIYRGNPLTHTNLASFDFMNEGDPRMTPFRIIGTSTSHTWATYEPGASYFMGNGRSSFGGWNTNSNLSQLSLTNLLEPSYPLTPGNMPTGPVNANGIFAVLPTSVVPIAPEPTKALQKLNNTGTFSNIFELGNIFDPVQWSFSSSAVQPGGSIPTNALATGPATRRGGGNTLRIGRAEHGKFAWTNVSGQAQPHMQASAAALLDLFCADTNTSAALSGRFDDGDQININTAPPRVLRALAAGIILTNDPAMKPSNNYSVPITAIDAFVKGVTNFRAKYPFYSASQLAFIGTDASWPNTGTWPTGAVFTTNTMGITAGNDAAVEEWFSKIYSLSKVQTRNYRIYVQAQLIKTRGTNTNSASLTFGAVGRRYYDVLNQQNNPNANSSPSCSVYLMRKVDY